MADTPSNIQPGAALRPPSAEIGTFRAETPVFQMIPPDQIGNLSPAARKLTKGDLLALAGIAGPKKTLTDLNITLQDIQTVSDAIQRQNVSARQAALAAGLAGDDISVSCCCCTPCCCCCAVAVIQPIRPLV
jgi:hypothetical protein